MRAVVHDLLLVRRLGSLRLLVVREADDRVGVLVGPAHLLLVDEREALAALLVVRRRLRHLLDQVEVRVVVVLNSCRSRRAWLDYNWVHILNLRYFYLLFSVFAR